MDKQILPAFTGIRFVAVLFVFLFHYAKMIMPDGQQSFIYFFFKQLNIGVSLFFILSGFLITYRYFNSELKGKRLRNYFLKRIARILPLYFAVLSIQLLLLYFYKHNSTDAFSVFLNITLLKGFSEVYFFSVLTQTWSLTVEETFYLFAPLCFYLIREKGLFYFQILMLLGIGFLLSSLLSPKVFGSNIFMLSGTFFGRCFEFFVGIRLALFILKNPVVKKKSYYTTIGGVLFILLLSGLAYYAYKENIEVVNYNFIGIVLFNFLIPLSIGLMYYGLIVENSQLKALLGTKIFVLLGNSSYAFYLLHIGLISEIIYLHIASNLILLFVILQSLSIVVYEFFEKPARVFTIRKFAKSNNQLG